MTLVLILNSAMVSKCVKCPRGTKGRKGHGLKNAKCVRVQNVPRVLGSEAQNVSLGAGFSQELISTELTYNIPQYLDQNLHI